MDNLNIIKIEENIKTCFIGRNIVYFHETGSTNDYAFAIIKEHRKNSDISAAEKLNGTVIISEIQKKGRGRFNRKWVSPAGGLWFTIILASSLDLKDLQNITLISALAVVQALETDFCIKVKIKWPNDIYFKDMKAGGILVESEKIDNIVFLITGLGLNVNLKSNHSSTGTGRFTSLSSITGRQLDREILLCRILEVFEKYYEIYTTKKSFSAIFKKIEKYMIY